ncbi:hypothetical protein L873DRAFT_1272256 [Choiromyces venosus 120613-1]|uniref:Uncharacterized protein n=1 Tax=Choiromyces venosus 120613-1 TaxID=1336337 RepID=A0A3N4K1T7_9PEZI|nr:hypothetical protein L873DRAFT_1272256 [Choiromyces venosus 120613-1]
MVTVLCAGNIVTILLESLIFLLFAFLFFSCLLISFSHGERISPISLRSFTSYPGSLLEGNGCGSRIFTFCFSFSYLFFFF